MPPAAQATGRATLAKAAAAALLLATVASVLLFGSCGMDVMIVDVVPDALSYETDPNPEPAIAVNPQNTRQVVVSAFNLVQRFQCDPADATGTCGLCSPELGGVVITTDGGDTWGAACTLPLNPKDKEVDGVIRSFYYDALDVSLGYSGTGSTWYAGYLTPPQGFPPFRVVAVTPGASGAPPTPRVLTPDTGTERADQPYVATQPAAAADVVVVGVKQDAGVGADPCAAGVVWWWDKEIAQPAECATERPVEHGVTEAVRLAVHSSGKTYGVFYHRTDASTTHVVLVGGSVAAGATGVTTALREATAGGPGLAPACGAPDGRRGIRIACRIALATEPGSPYGPYPFGNQRRGFFTLAIAVDPGNADRVAMAYLQDEGTTYPALQVALTTDGGRSPVTAIRTVPDAINPALAISADGRIGLLYQEFVASATGNRWRTYLEVSDPAGDDWKRVLLADTPADVPGPSNPYVGDYVRLEAHGTTFHGAFSANNDPQHHPDARYLRTLSTASDGARALPAGVAVSMDPFYFRVTPPRPPIATMASWVSRELLKLKRFINRPPPEVPGAGRPTPTPPPR